LFEIEDNGVAIEAAGEKTGKSTRKIIDRRFEIPASWQRKKITFCIIDRFYKK
jgi:hypothetical protein